MPRAKSKPVKENEVHKPAPWQGYINLTLSKEDQERLSSMVHTMTVDSCIQEMVDKYYRVSLNYDAQRGYRALATGCLGSKNAGYAISGYSGSSLDNAIFSLYYRLAMMLEYEKYQEIQTSFDFG